MAGTGAEIANAYVALTVKAPGIQKDIEKSIGGSSSGVEKSGRSLGSSLMKGMKVTALAGAAAVGGAIIGTLGVSLTKGFQRLKGIDNATAKMKGLGFSAEETQGLMDNALESVKGTAFGLEDAAGVAAQMAAGGIGPGEEMADVLSTVANNAAAAGGDLSEMGSVFSKALTQANGVQNDVIGQLADKGIPIYQALADQLGVTSGEVFKMASEGKINFEQFAAAAKDAAGGVAEAMGDTATGSWDNFMASLGRSGAGLLGGVFEGLAPALQGITEAMGPLEEVAGDLGVKIGEFLAPGFEYLANLGDKIDLGAVASAIESIYNLVVKGDFTSAFREAFGFEEDSGFVTFILTIRDAVVGLFDLIVKGDFSGALRNAFGWEEDNPMVLGVLTVRDAVIDFAKSIPTYLGQAFTWVQENWDWLSAIVVGIGGAAAAFKLWQGAILAWQTVTKIATGIQVAFNLVMSANPIMLVITAIAALVAGLVYFFTQTELGKEIWANFTQFLTEAWTNITTFLTEAWTNISNFFVDTWTNISNFFTDTINNIVSFFEGAIEGFSTAWEAIWTGIGDFLKGIWNSIIGWIEGGVNGAIDLINGLMGGIRDVAGFIGIEVGEIPHVSIPRLAEGGVVNRRAGGTLAVVGEGRYDEAVIPLSPQILSQIGGGGGGNGGVQVDVHPSPGMDEALIGRIAGNEVAYALRG